MNVFVSYRRSDSQDIAARIADRLNEMPGVRKVFIDVDEIEPGGNFPARIAEALDNSDLCLILIGDDWIGIDPNDHSPRIHDVDDFVRREAAAALSSDKKVIPLLLNDAVMPSAAGLPEDIRTISCLSAEHVRHRSFNSDLRRLEDVVFSRRARTRLGRYLRRYPLLMGTLKAMGGMIVAVVLLVLAAVIHNAVTGRALSETFGGAGSVKLLVLVVIAIGGAVPLIVSRWRHP